MEKIVSRQNRIKAALSLLIPAIIIAVRPIDLTFSQSVVLGGLFLVIVWWGTEWVHKDVASAVLLVVFLGFSGAKTVEVLNFPCSTNIIMIVTAYLLSQGIVNSNIAEQFSNYCISRFCKTGKHLVILAFVLALILLFVMPQPFPRLVLLATIYLNFLKNHKIHQENQSVLVLSIFVAVPITSMMLLNGDVIINYAAMGFGGIELSYAQWAKYMTLPTIAVAIIAAAAFMVTFRKDLNCDFRKQAAAEKINVGKDGKFAIAIMAIVIVLWLTESMHGLNPALVALLGTVLMFAARIVHISDFKVISPSLLLFLTAEFAIGRSLIGSGVAEKIKEALVPVLPAVDSPWFIPVIAAVVILLHMVMGSIVTAISFSIPMLSIITEGYWTPEFTVMFVLVIVCYQFLLPFHNINIMIGYGSGYFENRHTMKIGLVLTIITVAALFVIYMPWWNLTGLI